MQSFFLQQQTYGGCGLSPPRFGKNMTQGGNIGAMAKTHSDITL